jgi:hypothetical protein
MLLKNEKNPLHASALRLRDLTVGRHIIVFETESGALGEYIVISRPFVDDGPDGHTTKVMLRDVNSGLVSAHYTEDMGVTMYPVNETWEMSQWNLVVFTVDHRKRHLLPELHLGTESSLLIDGIIADDYANDVKTLARILTGLEAME